MRFDFEQIAKDMGMTVNECRQKRIDYLNGQFDEWLQVLNACVAGGDDEAEYNRLCAANAINNLLEIAKEIRWIARSMLGHKPKAGEITQSMIEQARSFPVERLIDFDRTGKALSFCHDDTRPSLYLYRKNNSVSCFVCNKHFDPIAVLMERDGLSFREAIRDLI